MVGPEVEHLAEHGRGPGLEVGLEIEAVGEVLERLVRRMERHLRRSGQLRTFADEAGGEGDPEANLAASAVFGQAPPAGPQWVSRLAPLEPQALAYDKPLCASLDGFTLHAATRAGALDSAGREALLRYVLRPPVAQERVEQRPDGLVRITLKKAYNDGTIAVDMDPLSLLCRLATSVPPSLRRARRPRFRAARRVAVRRIGRAACSAGRCSVRRRTRGRGAPAAGQTRWRSRRAIARGPWGGAVCPLRGVGAAENPGAGPSEAAGLRSGGGPRVGVAARDDAG